MLYRPPPVKWTWGKAALPPPQVNWTWGKAANFEQIFEHSTLDFPSQRSFLRKTNNRKNGQFVIFITNRLHKQIFPEWEYGLLFHLNTTREYDHRYY